MGKSQHTSMWMRLLILFFTMSVFVMVASYYFTNHYRMVVAQEREVLRIVAKNLELNLNVRLMTLQILAANVHVRTLQPEKVHEELVSSMKILNFFNARVFDTHGKLVQGVLRSPDFSEVQDQESFNKALLGKPVISNVIASEKSQNPYVSLRVPVYNNDDQVQAVLAGGILLDELGKLIEAEKLPFGHYIFIKDNNNRIIYYPGLKESLIHYDFARDMKIEFDQDHGGEVVDKLVNDEDDKMYLYSTLENSNWHIVMVVPYDQVKINVLRRSGYHLSILCLILLCAGLLYRNFHQARKFDENVQRLRMERLISVNQLAAGLAHEVRNPLTAINGFIQLMSRKVDQAPNQNYLEIVSTEINRIDQLLGEFQLLTLPLKAPEFIKVDIEEMTNDVILLMRGQAVSKGVALTVTNKDSLVISSYVDIADGSLVHIKYQVLGEKAQLKQVLINLLKNAIDAVNCNGMVDVILSSRNKMVLITVRDDGVGMSSDVLGKVGTPFFTTKEDGNGMGLSVCYNIVKNHGGRIEVDSEVGKGTEFSVILPCIE